MDVTAEQVRAYGDTDSYAGDTIIETKDRQYTAIELHNKYANIQNTILAQHGQEIINIENENIFIKTFDSNKQIIKWGKIKNLFRHKVTKQKYKIVVDNKVIYMTSDHGCMVMRDNKLIRVKPADIQSGDKMIICRHNKKIAVSA